MNNQTIELLRHFSESYNTDESRPNCKVEIYRKDKKGGYETAPFDMPNIMDISLDRRYNMAADELKVTFSNVNGMMSPNYSPDKDYDHVKGMPLSGYTDVLTPFNMITLDLGYGDEMRRMFTGQIISVTMNEKSPTIKLTCKNMYRKLLKAIDPEDKKVLFYEKKSAGFIINDLLKRAKIDKAFFDSSAVDGKEYEIPKKECQLGMQYSDAIKDIVEMLAHRIYCNREGIIIVEPIEHHSQNLSAKLALDDYLNMTSGEYTLDPTILRNRVVIQTNECWQAFEDPYLLQDCNNEKISCGLEVPWAKTEEMRQAVADRFFTDMRRKMRKISVGIKGHPALDVGDLVKVRALISTANSNYMVTGIKTSFSTMGYVDTIDLEFVTEDGRISVPAEGQYENVPGAIGGGDSFPERTSTRGMIVKEALRYLSVWYEAGGDCLHQPKDFYGLDAPHFTWYVYEKFNLMDNVFRGAREQYKLCKAVTREELQKGDLVFYSRDGSPEKIGHIGIYIGDNKAVSASGGHSGVTTIGKARNAGAFVKVHFLDNGSGTPLYGTLL